MKRTGRSIELIEMFHDEHVFDTFTDMNRLFESIEQSCS